MFCKLSDAAVGSTTCGVVLKTLVKAPIYCDGSSVVILVPLPGGGAGASTRSLFGSGGSISSLRCESAVVSVHLCGISTDIESFVVVVCVLCVKTMFVDLSIQFVAVSVCGDLS